MGEDKHTYGIGVDKHKHGNGVDKYTRIFELKNTRMVWKWASTQNK